jgi:hypothetical protein
LALRIGDRIRLDYVRHGERIPDEDEAVPIGHHSEYAVLVARAAKRAGDSRINPTRPASRVWPRWEVI